jgi:hypothetical protein
LRIVHDFFRDLHYSIGQVCGIENCLPMRQRVRTEHTIELGDESAGVAVTALRVGEPRVRQQTIAG